MAGIDFGVLDQTDGENAAPAPPSGIDFGTMSSRKNNTEYNNSEATTYNIDFDATRKKSDLTKGPEAEQLRDYMIERFGEDYRRQGTIDNETMVEDFFNHMRYLKSKSKNEFKFLI